MWIFLGLLVLAGGIAFLVALIKCKNTASYYHEKIAFAKSNVRITKAKYVQIMKKGKSMHSAATDAASSLTGQVVFTTGVNEAYYGLSLDVVTGLANEYQAAQTNLNKLVIEWNQYIATFPWFVFAKILKLQREALVDDEKLDLSTSLSDTIDDDDI